jgi:hypothetical protein
MFGPASTDEMCNSVILYYPVKRIFGVAPWACIINITISACDATLTTSLLDTSADATTTTSRLGTDGSVLSTDSFNLERTFGYNAGSQCLEKIPSSQGNDTSSARNWVGQEYFSLFCLIVPVLLSTYVMEWLKNMW